MNIVYVGDGRTRANWGAQATSSALYELISVHNTVTAVITSDMKLKKFAYLPFLTSLISETSLFKKATGKKGRSGRIAFRMLNIFGFQDDYISSDDANISVENFLKIYKYYPELLQIYNDILRSDAVVLNGEGSFIFRTPARRDALFFLFILKLAKRLGKKAFCLNAMLSDCPVSGRNDRTVKQIVETFKVCDGIALRDKFSFRLLKELAPDLDCKFIPDALFSWSPLIGIEIQLPDSFNMTSSAGTASEKQLDFAKPYLCISGSSAAAWVKSDAIPPYIALINKLKEIGIRLYIVPTCEGDVFLEDVAKSTDVPIVPIKINVKYGAAILANARVFISGRFHPSIMASDGGTPCVFLGSNSHKTLTLQEVLEYPNQTEYNAIPSTEDIERIFNDVKNILLDGNNRREKIKNTVLNLAEQTKELSEIVR